MLLKCYWHFSTVLTRFSTPLACFCVLLACFNTILKCILDSHAKKRHIVTFVVVLLVIMRLVVVLLWTVMSLWVSILVMDHLLLVVCLRWKPLEASVMAVLLEWWCGAETACLSWSVCQIQQLRRVHHTMSSERRSDIRSSLLPIRPEKRPRSQSSCGEMALSMKEWICGLSEICG